MKTRKRRALPGYNLILFIGIFFAVLMASVLSIDMAFYFTAQNQMRTAADAAALAGTLKLFNSDAASFIGREEDVFDEAQELVEENFEGNTVEEGDVELGFIDPITMDYDPETFGPASEDDDYETTNGYNAVRVTVNKTEGHTNGALPTIMANVLGISTMETSATSVALMDSNISSITNGGLRPIYVCKDMVEAAFSDGNPGGHTASIYGDQFELDGTIIPESATCPAAGSGNWGFADLRHDANEQPVNGAVGANTMGEWFADGFDGTVNVDQVYGTQPGNSISNNNVEPEVQKLIDNHTVITLPVFDSYSGGGSNTQVTIHSFVGFVIDSMGTHGSDKYVIGHFTNVLCRTGCRGGSDNASVGNSVVRVRLAPLNTDDAE